MSYFLIIKRNLIRFLTRTSKQKLMQTMTLSERKLKKLSNSTKNFMKKMSFKMMLRKQRSSISSKTFDVNWMRSTSLKLNREQRSNYDP
mgnify:CR=1 FL=1